MTQINKDNNSQFYFDQERLQQITDKKTISMGIADHREDRVMEIDYDENVIWGQVEGENPDIPESVTIEAAEDSFSFNCECSEAAGGKVRRHSVAVLCKYAALSGIKPTNCSPPLTLPLKNE